LDWLLPQSTSLSSSNHTQVVVASKPLVVQKETVITKWGLEPEAKQQGPSANPNKKYKFGNDALGMLVHDSVALLLFLFLSWEHYVATICGESHLTPKVAHLQHPAGLLLV
jgi:hypothetical protein